MDNWKVKDMIKNGQITYNIGDVVVLWTRKRSGYPKEIEDNVDYTISKVDIDKIVIRKHSADDIGWMSPIRIDKIYILPKNILRDIKLNYILS